MPLFEGSSKHDADCLRRKRERNAPLLCSCDMSDAEVATAIRVILDTAPSVYNPNGVATDAH